MNNIGILIGEPDVSIVATIIFSTTSGLFTLFALISIFIAINRQHNIEKARELFWEFPQFPYKYTRTEYERDSSKITSEVNSKLKLYEITTNSNNDHTKNILNVATIIIFITSCVWIISIFGIFYGNSKATYTFPFSISITLIIICLIFYFLLQLYKIFDIEKISNLPKYEKLLDIGGLNVNGEILRKQQISEIPQVTKVLLLIMGMRMKLHADSKYNSETEDEFTDYKLRFLFPGAFYNFKLYASAWFFETGSESPLANSSFIVGGERYSDSDKSIEIRRDSLQYSTANMYYFLDLFTWPESRLENIDMIEVNMGIDYCFHDNDNVTPKSLFTVFKIKNLKKNIYDFRSPSYSFAVAPSIYPINIEPQHE